ncbi:lysozyme family protein [Magnetospirillum molischianum]|uniref:Lysozyme n=1 Tax=Magnetospirillum molischianum DSM 120 TaxID=1150626 RepID=H8FXT4_MAGML
MSNYRGISEAEALALLDNDIAAIASWLDRDIPWWQRLSDARQRALINMAMMGVPRLLGFKRMLAAMQARDFERAAAEALDSKWADDVGERSRRVATLIRAG